MRVGLKPEIDKSRFSQYFAVEFQDSKRTQKFFEELFGKLVMGSDGHSEGELKVRLQGF
jgi:hypothetical protein